MFSVVACVTEKNEYFVVNHTVAGLDDNNKENTLASPADVVPPMAFSSIVSLTLFIYVCSGVGLMLVGPSAAGSLADESTIVLYVDDVGKCE